MSKIEQALAKAAEERKLTRVHNPEQLPFNVFSPDFLSGLDQRLVAFFSASSLAAEQYRHLRTKILRAKKLYSHNTFLVSSAMPGEGKTVTAISLAITIAQGLHDTVLVVDSDLRKPGVHRMLGISREKGLTELLTGKAKLEEVLVKTKIDKLSIIPAGSIPTNPSELMSSEEMGKLITELKTRYQNRIIIFDSPPIISLTDSIILSHKVDEVVLIVYANQTPKEAVADALDALGEANIMGVVLNHFDSTSHYYRRYRYRYNYKYKYGYRYGYGYSYGSDYKYDR